MIVSITLPANAAGAKYGRIEFQAAEDHTLDIPDYVAKALLTLPGAFGLPEMSPTADLLARADADWELNYLFLAHGRAVPQDKYEDVLEEVEDPETHEKTMVRTGEQRLVEAVNLKALAAALFAERGEPAVVLT